MIRFTLFVTCTLAFALFGVPASADDPPRKLMPEEREQLLAKWTELRSAAGIAFQAGKLSDAEKAFGDALEVARRLYPKAEFPDGHATLASSLTNLGLIYQIQESFINAESLFKEALDMRKRLFKGDHLDLANSLNNLAGLYKNQERFSDAETLQKDALEMNRRLFKGDNYYVALNLTNLADLYQAQGKLSDAEPLYKHALAMRKRLFKGDHQYVAISLEKLADLYQQLGKLAEAEPLQQDALDMNKRLFTGDHPSVADSMSRLGLLYKTQGRLSDSEALFKDALEVNKRRFKGDSFSVARSLNDLAALYQDQGRLAEAELLFKDALDMSRRLSLGKDHSYVATNLHNLGSVYVDQGKFSEAEPLFKEALATWKRLHKGDHFNVVLSSQSLAALLQRQGKPQEAERLFVDAVEMSKRLFAGDHPGVALAMTNLGTAYRRLEKLSEAEAILKDALAMRKRLYKGDHPQVAASMNNLGYLYSFQGKLADAEPLYKEALAMRRRLYKGDHPHVAASMNNLAFLSLRQGNLSEAEPLLREVLEVYKRLLVAYAKQKSEGETLSLMASFPNARDAFLSLVRARDFRRFSDPESTYSAVWTTKGAIARVYEQRQLQARAAADPALGQTVAKLVHARRRRVELLLAHPTNDANTLEKQQIELKALDETINRLNQTLARQLPAVVRADKLNNATLTELQRALPAGAAVIDYVVYNFFEYDNNEPVGQKEKQTWRYLAFVTTKDKVAWVDLDVAQKIDDAVNAWRVAITRDKEIPSGILAKVRELVWENVRKKLPADVKTVYVCPDAGLCRVPWGAIPGDKPGTILLEDFAIAAIPHAPFLLDKLWPQEPLKNSPSSALVVGGVKYDAELLPLPVPTALASRGGPLIKADAKLGWPFLPGTVAEVCGVETIATRKKLPITRLEGEIASGPAILAALPKAKYAHFATHGFFADVSFRDLFQFDEKEYEMSLQGERIGRFANSPMAMTGLVFAGANNPNTPGRGILTGESLIDLDLSGLELAVLSACETGLGDVAGGEGTFGLQRAFHMAGTRDVIASLWKVPDQSTAALMALFYRNLWEKNLSPMESLRQAQLEIYRNPGKIGELAKGFRGKFEEVAGKGTVEIKPSKDGTAHPLLWAAFTLSGPGR